MVPTTVAGTNTFTETAVGQDYTCALRDDGVPMCCECLRRRQHMFVLTRCLSQTPNETRLCAVHAGGNVVDQGTTLVAQVPTVLPGSRKLRTITAGAYHLCGIALNGSAYCFGRGRIGQRQVASGCIHLSMNLSRHHLKTPVCTTSTSMACRQLGPAWQQCIQQRVHSHGASLRQQYLDTNLGGAGPHVRCPLLNAALPWMVVCQTA